MREKIVVQAEFEAVKAWRPAAVPVNRFGMI
jgi:hypothetical protein